MGWNGDGGDRHKLTTVCWQTKIILKLIKNKVKIGVYFQNDLIEKGN
jgi:hypothetical protein